MPVIMQRDGRLEFFTIVIESEDTWCIHLLLVERIDGEVVQMYGLSCRRAEEELPGPYRPRVKAFKQQNKRLLSGTVHEIMDRPQSSAFP